MVKYKPGGALPLDGGGVGGSPHGPLPPDGGGGGPSGPLPPGGGGGGGALTPGGGGAPPGWGGSGAVYNVVVSDFENGKLEMDIIERRRISSVEACMRISQIIPKLIKFITYSYLKVQVVKCYQTLWKRIL